MQDSHYTAGNYDELQREKEINKSYAYYTGWCYMAGIPKQQILNFKNYRQQYLGRDNQRKGNDVNQPLHDQRPEN